MVVRRRLSPRRQVLFGGVGQVLFNVLEDDANDLIPVGGIVVVVFSPSNERNVLESGTSVLHTEEVR